MNIGSIGKVIANQAFETTKKSMMEAVTGPEARPATEATPKTPPAPQDIGAIITGQIQAMQRPLRDDQELQISVQAGQELLRVNEVFVPNIAVLVFSGFDNQGNVTRVIMPADQVQLVCKIVAVLPGNAAKRVNVLTPRPPRPEGWPAPNAPPVATPAQNS